jgi:hypothetical protein
MPEPTPIATLPLLLPPTSVLLVQGGDQRIEIQPGSQVNKYGCQPFPAADRIAFASSTASQISVGAFEAADRLRERIAAALPGSSAEDIYRTELTRIRNGLLLACGLMETATQHAPDVIFAASGTDAHLLASHLAAAQARRAQRALRVIMVNPEESGSGVSTALSGCSFSAYNALGDCNAPPNAAAGHDDPHQIIPVKHVAIRHPDGNPRRPELIAADVQSLSEAALQDGCDVLLVLIDVSKTGCISPEPAFARQLQQRWPGRVHVLVDACQFRIETASLRAYLAQDFMVAITGSKFIGGPSFSAALLIPPAIAATMRTAGAPAPLHRHSAREEWPASWRAERTLSSCANPGLLLRWEAALYELKALQAIPGERIRTFLLRFNDAVQSRLLSDPHFEALASPALPSRAAGLTPQWDDVPSIHAFTLLGPAQLRMSTAQVADIYRRLQQTRHSDGFIYSVGQPVACGKRGGIEVSALRLCISAGMVVLACSDAADAATAGNALIAHAMACLDAIADLISKAA